MKSFSLTFLSIFIATFLHAQFTEKIETDRPDQTETPFIIPKKYLQAEFGFSSENYKNNVTQFIHPTTLLKYGISNRIELRLEATYLSREEMLIPQPKTATLLEPVEIGTKIRFFEEKGLLPKTSVLVHFGMPFIADKQYHSDPVNFSVRMAMQNSLSENVALGYNFGVEGGGSEETSYIYTISSGFNLGSKWYSYIEAFGSFFNGYSENNLDGGFAYFTSKNTKIDLSAGFGLGNAPLKHYVAVGFSLRLPTGKH
jgi:hypothetical protein